jgi:hypothetical protein
MKKRMLKKVMVFGAISALIIVSLPSPTADVEYFNNSIVLITGNSNSTSCLGLWWKIGLYIPIVKRQFIIEANSEEGESLNVIIMSSNHGLGAYYDYEDIRIELQRARGIFYWGGKSLLFNNNESPSVFVLCRAKMMYVTT